MEKESKQQPKFTITTLGCKVNQYESGELAKGLVDSGYTRLDNTVPSDNGTAEVCIINTCTVTHKASMQSRQAIRQAVRNHPDAAIFVTGCYAQTEPQAIQKIEGVHRIVPHRDKHRIPAIVSGLPNSSAVMPDKHTVQNRFDIPFPMISPSDAGTRRTRPFLKIQDGCDAFCTYCIVPHARGSSRSMAQKMVLEQLQGIKRAGYREVVLTGIHLGRYGHDLQPPTTLFHLLQQAKQHHCIDRLRLSSIEPLELSADIIRLAAESESTHDEICRHFHIPLQSGDDTILKKMRRPYRRKAFRDLVHTIRKAIPDAGIGADVLVGFPGETDEAFEKTYSLIRELPLTYLHVFPFSPREGTPANRFPDKIPPKVIKDRCRRVRELGMRKKKAFLENQIGRSAVVLVENRRDRNTALLKGITSNYITVLTEGSDDLMNTFQEVHLDHLNDDQSVSGKSV